MQGAGETGPSPDAAETRAPTGLIEPQPAPRLQVLVQPVREGRIDADVLGSFFDRMGLVVGPAPPESKDAAGERWPRGGEGGQS